MTTQTNINPKLLFINHIKNLKSGQAFMLDGDLNDHGHRLMEKMINLSLPAHKVGDFFYLMEDGKFEATYKLLMTMMYRIPMLANVHADVVLEDDEFLHGIENGAPFVSHRRKNVSAGIKRISLQGSEYCGFEIKDIIGSFAVCLSENPVRNKICVVNQSELIAASSNGMRANSPWSKYPGEMAKKVAIKRLAKTALSACVEVAEAIEDLIEDDNAEYKK